MNKRGPERFPFLVLGVLAGCSAARSEQPLEGSDPVRPRLAGRLESIFGGHMDPESFGPVRWIEAGSAFTVLEEAAGAPGKMELVRYEAASGMREVLVSAESLERAAAHAGTGAAAPEIEDHWWAADERRLLLQADTRKVWRQNTRGDYWVLEPGDDASASERSGSRLVRLGSRFPESSLMFAKFSPDGSRVAYVQANDLWVEELESGALTRLTSDGSPTIVNGTSDWVYEEELDVRDGFRWSPDGSRIAFWRFDSSGLGLFPLVDDTGEPYPTVRQIPYPKAGTRNSAVTIGVVPAGGGEPVWLAIPGDPRENYLARMEWLEERGEILVQQLNRRQDAIDVWLADGASGEARLLLHDEDAAWLDVVDDWRWVAGGRELLWLSERDGWRHAWAVPRDGGEWRLLTPGDFDLLSIEGVDESRSLVYVTASPGDPKRRALHCVPLEGGAPPERLTPEQTGSHAYDLSPDARFALHTRSTIDRPPAIELVRLPAHETVRELESNGALAEALAPWPGAEFIRVELEPGEELDGWMIRPGDLDPARTYPLLLYVYGEPSAFQASDGWKGKRQLFHRALAEAGYVVACVDNRGTPAPRGRAWRKLAHGRMGAFGASDLAGALRGLLRQFPYLDPGRVAVWGWSGGGTMTLHLLFRHPELFQVGLSVAPVPDSRLYDSIYQERYLGLPQENPEGYDQASPILFAEGLEDPLLLVHGSGDDNVHFQGSERLIDRLVALGKPFDLMVYPHRTHAISEGEGTSLHLHTLLARYLMEHVPPGAR